MLVRKPKIGEYVKVLKLEDFEVNGHYETIGKVYKIEGTKGEWGNPYFIDNKGTRTFIDEASFYKYEVVDENDTEKDYSMPTIHLTNLSVYTHEESGDFSFDFVMKKYNQGEFLQHVVDFEKDIRKLIEEKYS